MYVCMYVWSSHMARARINIIVLCNIDYHYHGGKYIPGMYCTVPGIIIVNAREARYTVCYNNRIIGG